MKECIDLESALDDEEGLRSLFQRLGELYETSYEIALTKIVERCLEENPKLVEKIDSILEDVKDKKAYLSLLYMIFTYHRRMLNITKMKEVLEKHKRFDGDPIYIHMKVMWLKFTRKKDNIIKAIKMSKMLMEKLPEHAGIAHNFASTIADAVELGLLERNDELVRNALKVAERLIVYDYPTYHATYGRLLGFLGHYEDGIEEITMAIDLENPDKKDYSIRMMLYQKFLIELELYRSMDITLERFNRQLRKMADNISVELKEMMQQERQRNIELLALFTALIAIIITTLTSIAENPNVNVLLQSSLTIVASSLVVLGAFHYMTTREKLWQQRALLVIGVGIFLMILILLLTALWKGG
ncbi:hypothetical protein IPA_05990 [Ignicoccus pacificus DSM 13166]|uniref:Tetratricopeptide repeat protein n=1 Tax=Ignicoccus pacificus DSM 13166 TaxID=940294 RepID=A0A977KBF8_9CREN|nr:hypothetical protein IPA_05990 [Ignicoccus pacificus DSM 13166]